MPKTFISGNIEREEKQALQQIAKNEGVSLSIVIRWAIKQYLKSKSK